MFNDPRQRADAIFLLAQCTAADASTDPNRQKDAAIGYMRVVAVCSQLPGKPHVAESLLAVGKLEEQLKNPAEAAAVYKQITDEFKNSPAADPASEGAGSTQQGRRKVGSRAQFEGNNRSMNKFIRKNQKKMLAVFSILLMIVFVVTLGYRGPGTGGGAEVVVAHMGKTAITGTEMAEAKAEWAA